MFTSGANVAVVAKTTKPHPKLPGTIYTAVEEIEKAGGKGLAIQCDIRDEKSVQEAVDKTVATFGGIDIVVNNASAISLTSTEETPMKKYDLMHAINGRGTYLVTKLTVPHLRKSDNAHVLTISPPLDMFSQGTNWFKNHPGYTMAKYSMTLYTYGFAEEFKSDNIAFNTLWPRTAIATAAVKNLLGGDESVKKSRKPEIMGDAAYTIITSRSETTTGNYYIDDEVLISLGCFELSKYACVPGTKDDEFLPDYFC